MKAIVKVPRCPLRRAPQLWGELVDELLFGWEVDILEAADGWVQLRADYRYQGFALADQLEFREAEVTHWRAQPKSVLSRSCCDVLAAPRFQSATLLTLLRGGLLAVLGQPQDDWQRVALPDGREGYVRSSRALTPQLTAPPPPSDALRRAVCRNALSYMGVPYRWGGKTPLGIDCSGLTFMAYRLAGVSIYRDAALKGGFPIEAVPLAQLCPADLLYYPGHVALYLGDGQYIHSTGQAGADGVVINSLDPNDPAFRPDLARDRILVAGRYLGAAGASKENSCVHRENAV